MKKEEVGRLTEQRALDTLTEKIESFEIEGNDKEQITLYLYPLQLGRLAMISRRLIDLDLIFDDDVLDYIVDKAIEFKLGARGLRSITETIIMDKMYEMPSKKEKTLIGIFPPTLGKNPLAAPGIVVSLHQRKEHYEHKTQ